MAHECTQCGRTFPDGSTEMLAGCPSCGGNRFQYLPSDRLSAPDEPAEDGRYIEADPDPDYVPPEERTQTAEDRAQAAARSAMVDPTHLPRPKPKPSSTEAPADNESTEASDERPNLEELREQLDERFESIKIVDRGEYELNLMELYERRECIIELQENGRYVIEIPETLTDEAV